MRPSVTKEWQTDSTATASGSLGSLAFQRTRIEGESVGVSSDPFHVQPFGSGSVGTTCGSPQPGHSKRMP